MELSVKDISQMLVLLRIESFLFFQLNFSVTRHN